MQYIVDNFQEFFPTAYRESVRFVDNGYEQLVIELRDRSLIIYDDFDKRLRRLERKAGEEASDEDYKKEFGLKLRTIMRRMGETQATLAEATGISQGIISRYINGFSSPTYVNARKIAKALRCSIDDFTYEI